MGFAWDLHFAAVKLKPAGVIKSALTAYFYNKKGGKKHNSQLKAV